MRVIKAEPSERLRGLRDIAGEHVDMCVQLSVWRRGALAEFVQVAGGDVAPARGTEGMEADCCRRGGRFERAAKARVVGGEERIDASEGAEKPGASARSDLARTARRPRGGLLNELACNTDSTDREAHEFLARHQFHRFVRMAPRERPQRRNQTYKVAERAGKDRQHASRCSDLLRRS